MSTLRQILRLLSREKSMQSIIDMTGVSRNTLRKYLARFKECGLSTHECMELSDNDLHGMFLRVPAAKPNARVQALYKLMPMIERELKKRGVTLDLLWHEYYTKYPDGFRLTQFKQHVRVWLAQSNPTMHIEHKAGDKMQIDFTGQKLHVVDAALGVVRDVEVFVSILGASQLIYVEAVWSQTKEDLIAACINALEYYGGSPDAIVPDNLRSAVTKSDRYEPEINRAFEDCASHYGMTVLPARAYKPRDKALVEGAVKIVYTRIFAALRDRTFTTLADLNLAIRVELEVLNTAPFKGRAYSRRQMFDEVERDALAPLPRMRYELRSELRASAPMYIRTYNASFSSAHILNRHSEHAEVSSAMPSVLAMSGSHGPAPERSSTACITTSRLNAFSKQGLTTSRNRQRDQGRCPNMTTFVATPTMAVHHHSQPMETTREYQHLGQDAEDATVRHVSIV